MSSGMQLPTRLGKYELTDFLGGGMAKVYRAQDSILGRTVAVKILSDSGNETADVRARFLQEAKMASSVSHENIISVYDFGEEQGRPFMVMEFLVGQSLRDVILHNAGGDDRNKLAIALQVARSLGYIHTRRIIHRDVKPDNIHIDSAGRVKLMDFGIAKSEGTSLTQAGFTLGTPYYMAPEQVLGQTITPAVDIYAFGILLYELFSGTKPITDKHVQKIFEKILNEPIDLQPLYIAHVPAPVVQMIRRCTAKNPAERYPNFDAITTELENLLQVGPDSGETIVSLPSFLRHLPPSLRTSQGLALVSASVVLAIFLLVLLIARYAFHAI